MIIPSDLTKGISAYEVAKTIGVGAQDVATLCCKEGLNKWSRYKPIIARLKNTPCPLTITDFKNHVYGLDIPTTHVPSSFGEEDLLEGSEWKYKQPQLTDAYFKRLSDFHGYCTDVIPLVTVSEEVTDQGHYITFTFNRDEDNGNLTISNIVPVEGLDNATGTTLQDMYMGVAIYAQRDDDDSIGDFTLAKTTANKLVDMTGDAELSFDIVSLGLRGKHVYYMLFFSPVKMENVTTAPTTTTVYPIENGYRRYLYPLGLTGVTLWTTNVHYSIDSSELNTDYYTVTVMNNSNFITYTRPGSTDEQVYGIEFNGGNSSFIYLSPANTSVASSGELLNMHVRRIVLTDVFNQEWYSYENPIFNSEVSSTNMTYPLMSGGLSDTDNMYHSLVWTVKTTGERVLQAVNDEDGSVTALITLSNKTIGTNQGDSIITGVDIRNVISGDVANGLKAAITYRTNDGNDQWTTHTDTVVTSGMKIRTVTDDGDSLASITIGNDQYADNDNMLGKMLTFEMTIES